MTTTGDLITRALRMFGIIDQTESAAAADLAAGVPVLNDLLRSEQQDAAAVYFMKTQKVTLKAGTFGQIYTFVIGTAQASYDVQTDAVGVKALYANDVNLTVNRETRQAPKADVIRTLNLGIVNKWHQERQVDGSILVTAWQPPRASYSYLLDLGGRCPPLTDPAGGDTLPVPPEGVRDVTLMFGRAVCGGYGRPLDKIDPVLAQDVKATNDKWREWARGQQWMRFVRS